MTAAIWVVGVRQLNGIGGGEDTVIGGVVVDLRRRFGWSRTHAYLGRG